jgi:glycosyltransferase involved in cell wall biosynthesis
LKVAVRSATGASHEEILANTIDVKLVGVVGGSIGVEPFGRKTWSGLSYYFFSALNKNGTLHRAFGVQPDSFLRYALMAKSFYPRRKIWRKSFFLECAYRNAATKTLARRIAPDDMDHPFLQIGAMFDAPKAVRRRTPCFSFQDGNLAQSIKNDASLRALPARKLRAALKYESDLYQSLDGIFTTSEYLRESFMKDFGIPASRVVNVGAGVNLDRIPALQNDKKYDAKQILFIGVEFERKGGWSVLKAFRILRAKHKNAKLHIVGPRTLTLPADLSQGVEYHGHLQKGDPSHLAKLNQLFAQASLFVMPSLYEPFGVAPLEAMVNQVPVVVTNRWALKEMVRPGFNGALVEPNNIDDLYETMSRLFDDPEDLCRMGRNGRDFVLTNYTWERTSRRITASISSKLNALNEVAEVPAEVN